MYQIVYCNNPQGNHEETNSKYVVQKKWQENRKDTLGNSYLTQNKVVMEELRKKMFISATLFHSLMLGFCTLVFQHFSC